MTGSVGARWRATGSPEEAGAGVRVRHQAAEIPVTPSRRSSTSRAGSSLVPTYGSTGLDRSTSTTARGIGRLMSTKSIWNAPAPSSASIGSGTASPQNTCGETAPQSSPTPTGYSNGTGIRVGWLRGRACSTTRSTDGLAALAPTATGGEPLPKAVRCDRKTAAISVVRDRLREGWFRRSSRGAHAWRASREAPVSAAPSP